jgi:hypothetical protein
MRVLLSVFLGFAAFALVEAGVFHTRLYSSWLNADSSTGLMVTYMLNEQARYAKGGPAPHRNEVLAIGDSRMTLMPRLANELTPETGYTWASIAIAGSTPRCWYYMLREADPQANRYAAIVIGMENYDDLEILEDRSKRESDLNYVLPYLRVSDLRDFAFSYPPGEERLRAIRGILFKGTIYQQDLFDFLKNPVQRISFIGQVRHDSFHWYYDYPGIPADDTDVKLDFTKRTVTAAPDRPAAHLAGFRTRYLDPIPPDEGRESSYLRRWLGKLYEHYRGSQTRLVFLKLPRGPFVRPDFPPPNPHSSVHELAARPEVVLLPEHAFEHLEHPELYWDFMHLNRLGSEQFSHELAREVRKALGPPR